jgi:hypothetical protein
MRIFQNLTHLHHVSFSLLSHLNSGEISVFFWGALVGKPPFLAIERMRRCGAAPKLLGDTYGERRPKPRSSMGNRASAWPDQ